MKEDIDSADARLYSRSEFHHVSVKRKGGETLKSALWTAVLVLSFILVGSAFAADGAAIYAGKCSACHGQKGAGSPMAPALKGNEFITKGDAASITKVFIDGRAGKDKKYPNFPIDMPKNPMPEEDARALVNFLKGDLQK